MYVRDESKKHNASVGVILISPIMFVSLITGIIYGVIAILGLANILATNVTRDLLVSAVLILIGVVWDCICKYYYNFYEKCKIDFKDKSLIYTYDLNGSIIASSNITTKITIKRLKKFKLKGKNSIVFYGDITKKAPLRKSKNLKKVELPIDFIKRDEVLKKIEMLCEV